MWQLDREEDDARGALVSRFVKLDPFAPWLVRCDRIDFPLGGVAHRHTHPGPGIRYLLRGELEIETEGRSTFYGPGGAWFESGPDPVVARASAHAETSFVRVLVLPAEWAGRRTIRYVEAVDEPQVDRESFAWQVLDTMAEDASAGSAEGRFRVRFTVRSQVSAQMMGVEL